MTLNEVYFGLHKRDGAEASQPPQPGRNMHCRTFRPHCWSLAKMANTNIWPPKCNRGCGRGVLSLAFSVDADAGVPDAAKHVTLECSQDCSPSARLTLMDWRAGPQRPSSTTCKCNAKVLRDVVVCLAGRFADQVAPSGTVTSKRRPSSRLTGQVRRPPPPPPSRYVRALLQST